MALGTSVVELHQAVGTPAESSELPAIDGSAIAEFRRLGFDLRGLERALHARVRAELRSGNEFLTCYVDEFDFSV